MQPLEPFELIETKNSMSWPLCTTTWLHQSTHHIFSHLRNQSLSLPCRRSFGLKTQNRTNLPSATGGFTWTKGMARRYKDGGNNITFFNLAHSADSYPPEIQHGSKNSSSTGKAIDDHQLRRAHLYYFTFSRCITFHENTHIPIRCKCTLIHLECLKKNLSESLGG